MSEHTILGPRLSRRRVLQYGGALGAAATSSFISVRSLAADTAEVNMQLGWLASNGILGEVCAKRLGYYAEEGVELSVTPGGPGVDGSPRLRPAGPSPGSSRPAPLSCWRAPRASR